MGSSVSGRLFVAGHRKDRNESRFMLSHSASLAVRQKDMSSRPSAVPGDESLAPETMRKKWQQGLLPGGCIG